MRESGNKSGQKYESAGRNGETRDESAGRNQENAAEMPKQIQIRQIQEPTSQLEKDTNAI